MAFNTIITFLETDADTFNAVVLELVSAFHTWIYTAEDSKLSYDSSGSLSDMLTDQDTFVSTMDQFPNAHAQMKISSYEYDRFSFIEICSAKNICTFKHFSWYKGLVDIVGEDINDLYQEWFSNTLEFCMEMPQDVLENELSFEMFVEYNFFEY